MSVAVVTEESLMKFNCVTFFMKESISCLDGKFLMPFISTYALKHEKRFFMPDSVLSYSAIAGERFENIKMDKMKAKPNDRRMGFSRLSISLIRKNREF